MGKLKIGLIGCGWFAPFHVTALRQLADRVSVVWAADPDLDRASRIATALGARPLADYHGALADVDAVDILVPHHLHHRITLDCLSAGRHVLLEKPIATTLADADDMIAAAAQANRTFMVSYQHRYRPGMRALKQAIDSGRYGRLFMLDAMMDESLQGYAALGWLSKKATLGGGVFFSASPHMLDPLMWLGGEVRCLSMVGAHGGVDMEGEDTALSIVKFASGAVGATRHTWASPKSRIWYTLTATCEKAHLTLTTVPMGDLVAEGDHCPWRTRLVAIGETEEVLFDSAEGLDVVYGMSHFLDCVETGATPETDGRMARRMIELVLSAYVEAERRGANE